MSQWQKEKEEEWRQQTAEFHKLLIKQAGLPLAVIIVCIAVILFAHSLLTLPTVAAVVTAYFFIKAIIPAFRTTDKERHQDLQKILVSQEAADAFDAEMAAPPTEEIELLKDDGRLYFTEHYLVRQSGGPRCRYRIIPLDEIKSCQVFTNPRTTILGSSTKPHIIEFYNADRKTFAVIEFKGRAACAELEIAYQNHIPGAYWNLGKYALK